MLCEFSAYFSKMSRVFTRKAVTFSGIQNRKIILSALTFSHLSAMIDTGQYSPWEIVLFSVWRN